MQLHPTIWPFTLEPALYAVSQKVWVLTVVFASWAAWTDFRTRRIPNWLTVSGFLLGIGANSIFGGWRGAVTSLEGAGLALGLLLPLVLLRGLGAGDWKLMGAMGALMGWRAMLFLLIVSLVASGLMAVVQMIAMRRAKQTLMNTFALAKGLVTFGLRTSPGITLDNRTLLKLPFGVAVGAATVLSFALVHWPR
jgi:prepilin peptidase CpaA